jgi:hypothetical protein
MVRVRLSRKLRKSLKELTEDALCSPEKFVPESVLGKWYKEYVSEVGDGETPVERDSSNFNEWVRGRKAHEVEEHVQGKLLELIQLHLQ